jgi:hypothetical protein
LKAVLPVYKFISEIDPKFACQKLDFASSLACQQSDFEGSFACQQIFSECS